MRGLAPAPTIVVIVAEIGVGREGIAKGVVGRAVVGSARNTEADRMTDHAYDQPDRDQNGRGDQDAADGSDDLGEENPHPNHSRADYSQQPSLVDAGEHGVDPRYEPQDD